MKYAVKRTLDHDGRRYEPGSAVDMSPGQAQPLLELGVIERAEQSVKAPKKRSKNAS